MGPSSGEEAQLVVLDQNFMKCSKIDLITLISRMLSFFIDINDSHNIHGNVTNNRLSPLFLTRFHSKVPPNISIFDYLIRLTKYSSLESSVLITSVYYIDLLSNVYPEFSLNSLTVHRYLLTATTIASKGLCDSFCTNSHYAKVGGIRCNELNVLETEFLERVRYRVIPRDNTIKLCKLEYKYSPIEDINNDIHIPDELQNSGYNVLSTYYNKMVQLVGNCKSSKNSFRNVNYIFSINQDEIYNSMPELEKPNHIIPTQQANKKFDTIALESKSASSKTWSNSVGKDITHSGHNEHRDDIKNSDEVVQNKKRKSSEASDSVESYLTSHCLQPINRNKKRTK